MELNEENIKLGIRSLDEDFLNEVFEYFFGERPLESLARLIIDECERICWSSNNPVAGQLLAIAYRDGIFRDVDMSRHFQLLKSIESHARRDTIFALALAYFQGSGTDKDFEKALEYANRALLLGEPNAYTVIAGVYMLGCDKIEKNEAYAADICKKAIREFSSATAMLLLAENYSCKREYRQALKYAQSAYEHGSMDAADIIARAVMLSDFNDVEASWVMGVLQSGASLSKQYCMLLLGNCYLEGDYVERDEVRGLDLIFQAANSGNGLANFQLGAFYELGEFLTKNQELAWEHYNKAACEGNEFALFKVAKAYLHGYLGQEVDKYSAYLIIVKLCASENVKDAPFREELLEELNYLRAHLPEHIVEETRDYCLSNGFAPLYSM